MSPATSAALIRAQIRAERDAVRSLRQDMIDLNEMSPAFRREMLAFWCDYGRDAGACFACGA